MRLLLVFALLASSAHADDNSDRINRLEKTGFALARRGKVDEAIAAFHEILRLTAYPSGLLLYHLGKFSEETTKPNPARSFVYYSGYLAIEPDGAEAAEVKTRHQRLKARLATTLGRLSVSARAEGIPLRFNDVPLGSTNMTGLELPAGSYTVTAEGEEFYPVSEQVVVEAGLETRTELRLKKRVFKGSLTVVVDPPDATIRVDERVVSEKSPFTQKELPTRTVLVRIDKPGWDRWVRYVTIERDSEARVEARLEQTGTEVPIPPLPKNDD